VQVEANHEILEDIYEWFLINIKNASEPKEPKKADNESKKLKKEDNEATEPHISYRRQLEEQALTFSILQILQTTSAGAAYCLICPTASFDPEWMRNQDSRLNNHDELDFTRKPPNHHFSN
jgi:hypothetical protein